MEIILATNNANKVKELKRMLEPLGYTLFAQKEKGIRLEVEENGTTFEENAALKARAIHELTGGAPLRKRHLLHRPRWERAFLPRRMRRNDRIYRSWRSFLWLRSGLYGRR